jgi:DNA (cytosine-5)-methyltransferase 1
MTMKTLEIFSGAGGLAKGLEIAGFEHSYFVEINKDACESLRNNFYQHYVFEGDISEFDLNLLEDIDIVAGGPPCQPFSLGGKHKAHQDNRDMFPYAIRCIENLQPKAFIFENVKGLLRDSFSQYFNYIVLRLMYPHCTICDKESWEIHLKRLEKLNPMQYRGVHYDVSYKLLNAADYGVPQKRERVVIVGLRSDLDLEWNFPSATHTEDRLNWDKFVTGEYWEKHNISSRKNIELSKLLKSKYGFFPPEGAPWQTVRDALLGVHHPKDKHDIPDHIFKGGAKIYPGHTGSEIDQPSKTIKAGGHGVPGGENMIRYEDGTVRYFTTYEAKLIQTFPKDFIVAGAWSEAMRQIGNAVPVKLAEAIAKQLLATLQVKQVDKSFQRTINSYAVVSR